MNVNELNVIRNKMNKQFINRQPANDATTFFKVGIGAAGITAENKLLLNALIEAVAEKYDSNALAMFDNELNKGVKVVGAKGEKYYENAKASDAMKIVEESL